MGQPVQKLATESVWYGWQTLTVDGAWFATFGTGTVLAFRTSRQADGNGANPTGQLGVEVVVGSFAIYLLGGPIVHFVHANPGRGFASFGTRVGMPLLLGLIGAGLTCSRSRDEFCGLSGAVLGGGLGIAGAMALDAAPLARDDKPIEEAAVPHFYLKLDRRTAQVLASGTF